MINLFEEMSKVVDKVVKHYKSDFEIDKTILLEKPKKYYWMLRDAGTNLYNAEFILIKESEDYGSIEYYLTQSKVEAIFEINVLQSNGTDVFGTMKKITQDSFKKLIGSAKNATNDDKVKLLTHFMADPIWAKEGLDCLKEQLARQMKVYDMPKHLIQVMNKQKSFDEIRSLIKSQSEKGELYA